LYCFGLIHIQKITANTGIHSLLFISPTFRSLFAIPTKEQPARLEFGTDDGNKVWLNGKLVHENSKSGPAIPGEHKVNVTLQKGWNVLLLKITQDTGPWQFCLAIRKPNGNKLEGLSIQAGKPRKI
jgi:hypothetical protein